MNTYDNWLSESSIKPTYVSSILSVVKEMEYEYHKHKYPKLSFVVHKINMKIISMFFSNTYVVRRNK